MELQKLVIDEQERIFLNGVEIPHILEYCLKNSVESKTAELTIKMHVAIDSIGKQENQEAKRQVVQALCTPDIKTVVAEILILTLPECIRNDRH